MKLFRRRKFFVLDKNFIKYLKHLIKDVKRGNIVLVGYPIQQIKEKDINDYLNHRIETTVEFKFIKIL